MHDVVVLLRGLVANVDTELGHCPDSERVDGGPLRARAPRFEAITSHRPEEALGHLAPRRVVGAEEQYPRLAHVTRPATMSRAVAPRPPSPAIAHPACRGDGRRRPPGSRSAREERGSPCSRERCATRSSRSPARRRRGKGRSAPHAPLPSAGPPAPRTPNARPLPNRRGGCDTLPRLPRPRFGPPALRPRWGTGLPFR